MSDKASGVILFVHSELRALGALRALRMFGRVCVDMAAPIVDVIARVVMGVGFVRLS